MDPHNNAFANNNASGLFANSQNFNSYDNLNLFQNGTDSNFSDAGWGVNASNEFGNPNSTQSRGQPQQAVPSWQQSANHLSTQSAHQQAFNGQASPYGRSMNNSPAPFAQNNFPGYAGQQNFAYRQQPQSDPSLVGRNGQNFNVSVQSYSSPAHNAGTIAPHALDQNRNFSNSPYAASTNPINAFNTQGRPAVTSMQPQVKRANPVELAKAVSKGADAGMFSIINFDELSRVTNSERMGNFANVGKEAQEWDITRSAVPLHVPRKSRNELRTLAGNNASALAKIGKKSKTLNAAPRVSTGSTVSSPQIRYDNTSSEDDSSSDDDSDSSDDDEDPPLPAKRPESAKGGVEYDVIKAVYRPKRKTIDNTNIKKALADFWDVVKIIRDRWKADAAAVADAEEKKKAGELPLLKSRVKDQRDMMEAAFKSAIKHGHRRIIELLPEITSLLFVCYQFLLDRWKEDDCNGTLARAILEMMSQFTTLTPERMEKTHLTKVLPRFAKKGDAKTKYWVNKILSNADPPKEANSKDDQKKSAKVNGDAPQTKAAPVKKVGSESVAGVKRPAASTTEGSAPKKPATALNKVNGASAASRVNNAGAIKKPTSSDGSKTAAASTAGVRKTVVAKPSGFFSNLQSASKKPGTSSADKAAKPITAVKSGAGNSTSAPPKPTFSFAETMANLSKPKPEKEEQAPKLEKECPPETEEERTKRLRKERRRKLHVSFKSGEDLVQVRYFTHDPAEEIDHDSSQMRDVSDVGGEGRMFKQQQHMMDIDDEDEIAEAEEKLIDFKPPKRIDFSNVDPEERKRNYAPYGGGELVADSPECAKRDQHENNTLMVFYTDASQIPDNPKEPENPTNGEEGPPMRYFGSPDEKYTIRACDTARQQQPTYTQPQSSTPAFDLAVLMAKQQPQHSVPQNSNVQSILDTLRQMAPNQAGQSQPGMSAFGQQPFMGAQPPNNFQPPPPAAPPTVLPGQIDLAAILAQIQPGAQQQQQHAAYNFGQQAQNRNDSKMTDIRTDNPFYKTKTCRFWQEGRCQKGDACSYLHE